MGQRRLEELLIASLAQIFNLKGCARRQPSASVVFFRSVPRSTGICPLGWYNCFQVLSDFVEGA
jgi:hypothetical protein